MFFLFSVVDSGEENDLSPAFAPGSYFQNVVENSVSAKGMRTLNTTISKSDKKLVTKDILFNV